MNSEIILRDFWADILRVAHPNPITDVWRTLLTKSVVELAQPTRRNLSDKKERKINFKVTLRFIPLP